MQLISMVERILGDEPGVEEFTDAFNKAQQKLHRIIQREGSDGGLRFGGSYFAHLIAEQITEKRASDLTEALYKSKRRTAHTDTPHITLTIVSLNDRLVK